MVAPSEANLLVRNQSGPYNIDYIPFISSIYGSNIVTMCNSWLFESKAQRFLSTLVHWQKNSKNDRNGQHDSYSIDSWGIFNFFIFNIKKRQIFEPCLRSIVNFAAKV